MAGRRVEPGLVQSHGRKEMAWEWLMGDTGHRASGGCLHVVRQEVEWSSVGCQGRVQWEKGTRWQHMEGM